MQKTQAAGVELDILAGNNVAIVLCGEGESLVG